MIDYEKIINNLVKLREEEKEIEQAYDKYISLATDSHTPYFDNKSSNWYLQAIWDIDKDLQEELERFIYEIDIDKKDTRLITPNKWTEYMINSKEDFIYYLNNEYANNL